MRKDALIRQLMEQNKMLLMAKERQEVEMAAQGETLEVHFCVQPMGYQEVTIGSTCPSPPPPPWILKLVLWDLFGRSGAF